MIKHPALLCVLLLTTINVYSQELITAIPNSNTQLDAPALQQEKPDKPKPNDLTAFRRFVRIIVALLGTSEVKKNLHLIENLIIAILKTAHQIAQTIKPTESTAIRSLTDTHNEALILELTHAIVSEPESLEIYKKCTHNKQSGMDDQTKAILLNFAAIIQNFFNILQDPENRDNVAPNVMGMVAGMMNIGTIAATKGNVALDADNEIASYAQNLDLETKQTMYRMIFTAKERCSSCIDS